MLLMRLIVRAATIDTILAQGGSVILMSHLGRPKGVEKVFAQAYFKTTSDVRSTSSVCFKLYWRRERQLLLI
jgi:3-phosphoglycerate kinase